MSSAARESSPKPARSVDARSPFVRTAELLAAYTPAKPPINLSVGEPQHGVPGFVASVVAANIAEFGHYPAGKGIDRFRRAAAQWLERRYGLPREIDADKEILVLNGTREGLFLAAISAKRYVAPRQGPPAILLPNPFYAAYAAGAAAAECEIVYLPATRATGFLPDLDALDDALLARTVAFYLASPANPQGSVAPFAYLTRLVKLARRFGFLVFCDECYSEIYTQAPPPGVLAAVGADFSNVVVFQSLS
jgi:N-succinyldiaminopimelate aminotransferase